MISLHVCNSIIVLRLIIIMITQCHVNMETLRVRKERERERERSVDYVCTTKIVTKLPD